MYPYLNRGDYCRSAVPEETYVRKCRMRKLYCSFLRHGKITHALKAFHVPFKDHVYTHTYVCCVGYPCTHIYTVKKVEIFEQFLYLPASFPEMPESECQCFCNMNSFEQLIKPKIIILLCSSSFKSRLHW